jgi:hypothetical protein
MNLFKQPEPIMNGHDDMTAKGCSRAIVLIASSAFSTASAE